jgi:hypothetical protein
MSRVIVTRRDNIEDFDGENMELIDETIIGNLVKTHALTAQQIDPASGQLVIGIVMRAEVYWEHQRTPAFKMEDPEDLVWLKFADDETDDEEEEEESEDDLPDVHPSQRNFRQHRDA